MAATWTTLGHCYYDEDMGYVKEPTKLQTCLYDPKLFEIKVGGIHWLMQDQGYITVNRADMSIFVATSPKNASKLNEDNIVDYMTGNLEKANI